MPPDQLYRHENENITKKTGTAGGGRKARSLGKASGGGATDEQGKIGRPDALLPPWWPEYVVQHNEQKRLLPLSLEPTEIRKTREKCAPASASRPSPARGLLQARRVAQRRAGGLDQRRGIRKPAPKARNGRRREQPHDTRTRRRQRQQQRRRQSKDQRGGPKRRRRRQQQQQPERGRKRRGRSRGGRRQEKRGCYRGHLGEGF